ncbi:hypothetical protein E4582_02880 [Luteimonas yindakuii]|uniref:Cytochrome c n=1 Tax=Luteimonas yindakuii TaxID=2565782 RepID=A0A4Z1RJK3_9GAMM|nr:hypothetical protein [Luteimonas yindakuii]TKS53821.1 hypothetical protein E4582_02880 [Luteimonas yindakuii]
MTNRLLLRLRALLPLAIVMGLAGCTGGDDESNTIDGFQASFNGAMHCMSVHAAIATAGLGPLAVAEDREKPNGTVVGMREVADQLPLDESSQPTLRHAHRSLADQLETVAGRGVEAASALAKSESYRRDMAVLSDWYAAHCKQDEAQRET